MSDKIQARKEYLRLPPKLGEEVFHDSIYSGREMMKVVGIRQHEIELEGDYSGGTNPCVGMEWHSLSGAFVLVKIREQHRDGKTCQLHNLHCGYPDCEPELKNYGHYVKGKLVNEVEIIESKP